MTVPASIPDTLLDQVVLTSPLGVRFIDAATQRPVGEGLHASAWPAAAVFPRPINAVVTPGGVHAFHGLPGLRSFENSANQNPWNPSPVTRSFRVAVSDDLNRFLPCSFVVDTPLQGCVTLAAGSPPWSEEGWVPLFSAPSRQTPGLAVVRAELYELASNAPAAWAFVEATFQAGGVTQTARGLADAQGRLALMLPFPEGLARSLAASPPSSDQGLPPAQWPLTLQFFHEPGIAAGSSADYARCLDQPVAAASLGGSPHTPLPSATLTFGRELNLGSVALGPA